MPFSQEVLSILGDEIWLNFSLKLLLYAHTMLTERVFIMNWLLQVAYHLKMNPVVGPFLFSFSIPDNMFRACCLQYFKPFISVHAARGCIGLRPGDMEQCNGKWWDNLCGNGDDCICLSSPSGSYWPPLQIAGLQSREAAISVLRLRRICASASLGR